MESPVHYEQQRVHVHGEMTVYTSGTLKPLLLAELAAHADATELELSRVIEMDTAGLQILLAARRHASELGRQLRVVNPSRAVAEVLELCRLTALLASPADEPL